MRVTLTAGHVAIALGTVEVEPLVLYTNHGHLTLNPAHCACHSSEMCENSFRNIFTNNDLKGDFFFFFYLPKMKLTIVL